MGPQDRFGDRQPHARSLHALALFASKELVKDKWLLGGVNAWTAIADRHQQAVVR